MSKVTTKLQVTVPKTIAERFQIKPGDEISWEAAGTVIRVIPPGAASRASTVADRLTAFDAATERQRRRQRGGARAGATTLRGWRREDLYSYAKPR
jgi:AbrB family looped-hinge helix DNA binding protein